MANMQILVPEATVNYVKNPSMRFDYNLAGAEWNAVGSSLSRVLTYARFGIASLKVITGGNLYSEGTWYRTLDLVGVSSPVTASAYVRGSGTVRIRLGDNLSGNQWSSKPVSLRTDRWTRLSVTGRCTGGDDVRFYIETYATNKQATTFYVDGAQLETKAYATTYCDGRELGCRWDGIHDNSTSTRSPYTREGGRWVMISGWEREEEDVYMTVVSGLGVAAIVNNRQSYALSPGGFLDNVKITERSISLTFHVKHEHLTRTCKQALSLGKLHELRQMLIDVIKPDLTGGNEPFWIEYQDGDVPLYLKVHYDGGLEGDWDIRNQYMMSFPLNLIALSPMLTEDNQNNYSIKFQDNSIFNGIAYRRDGEWNNMDGGIYNVATSSDGAVGEIKVGSRGGIYAAGKFDRVNYGSTDQVNSNSISYYDGQQWINIASAIVPADTDIYGVAIAANGDVYVTGKFTSIGGVAANYIARWDRTNWYALGAGLDNWGVDVEVSANGDVYVGGYFHNAGGIPAWHVARWDGSSWHAMGAKAGFNNDVFGLAISKDGTNVYVAGSFTDQYSLAANALLRVAQYDVATNTFSAMGNGFNNTAMEIRISPSGYIYAGGYFTQTGIAALGYIGRWNGSVWEQLGTGLTGGNVDGLAISDNGSLIAAGVFTSVNGISVEGLALWNGSSWNKLDINMWNGGSGYTAYPLFIGEDIVIGGASYSNGGVASSIHSGVTYVTNSGSAEVRPTIYIKGPCMLSFLENQTTKKRLYFDLEILPDEEVFIEFGTGKFYSTIRGDLYYALLPGSDFHGFTLIPGENKIVTFAYDDVAAIMSMYYTPTHWSVDSTQHSETL